MLKIVPLRCYFPWKSCLCLCSILHPHQLWLHLLTHGRHSASSTESSECCSSGFHSVVPWDLKPERALLSLRPVCQHTISTQCVSIQFQNFGDEMKADARLWWTERHLSQWTGLWPGLIQVCLYVYVCLSIFFCFHLSHKYRSNNKTISLFR